MGATSMIAPGTTATTRATVSIGARAGMSRSMRRCNRRNFDRFRVGLAGAVLRLLTAGKIWFSQRRLAGRAYAGRYATGSGSVELTES